MKRYKKYDKYTHYENPTQISILDSFEVEKIEENRIYYKGIKSDLDGETSEVFFTLPADYDRKIEIEKEGDDVVIYIYDYDFTANCDPYILNTTVKIFWNYDNSSCCPFDDFEEYFHAVYDRVLDAWGLPFSPNNLSELENKLATLTDNIQWGFRG